MFEFEKPRIKIAEIKSDKSYGKFVIEPLERGYGTTLGNSLRRILFLSSFRLSPSLCIFPFMFPQLFLLHTFFS